MPEHLQGRAAVQPHHLGLHQQEAVPAQILRRVHGRALLHPLQVQDGGGGVPVSQRDGLQLEDAVDPGLLLQPQLQEPQRHLHRAGQLLRLLGNSQLTGDGGTPLRSPDFWNHFGARDSSTFFFSYWKTCKYEIYVFRLAPERMTRFRGQTSVKY